MNNVMAALPNIGGALCRTPQSLGDATYTARVPCSNAANIGERKTWTQRDFFSPGKIPLGDKRSRKCIYVVPAQETSKHRAKFG